MRLREAREARGLTQWDLAVRAGVHPNSISLLERGEMRPSPTMAGRLERSLGMELWWPGGLYEFPLMSADEMAAWRQRVDERARPLTALALLHILEPTGIKAVIL